jgi:hypothetical protein
VSVIIFLVFLVGLFIALVNPWPNFSLREFGVNDGDLLVEEEASLSE